MRELLDEGFTGVFPIWSGEKLPPGGSFWGLSPLILAFIPTPTAMLGTLRLTGPCPRLLCPLRVPLFS